MAVLTVPKILREKLSEEGAEALVELFDKVEASAHDNTLEVAEERFEKRLAEVKAEISILDEKFERRLAEVKGELKTDIASAKAEIIKWMFIFVFGQFWAIVGTITAILFAFFRSR